MSVLTGLSVDQQKQEKTNEHLTLQEGEMTMTTTTTSKSSRTALITLLCMSAFMLLSLKNTESIHRKLQQEQNSNEDNCYEAQLQRQRQQPNLLTNLIHLFETLPSATSENVPPPFREVTYAFPRQKHVPSDYITLSTQVSVSKLPRLALLLERWKGPISCAVHLPETSDIQKLYDFVQTQDKIFRDLVSFHAMLERPSPYYEYPANRMRNLALENLETDYFFISDVDFMPQKGAHSKLRTHLSEHSNASDTFTKLYVLPAFEVFGDGEKNNSTTVQSLHDVPKNKKELLSVLSKKKLPSFHMDHFDKGHAPANYEKWYKCPKDESYPVEYVQRWEPYVIGAKYGIPSFDERLRGLGQTNASWAAAAHLLGYRFEVLCDHFVLHMLGRPEGNDATYRY